MRAVHAYIRIHQGATRSLEFRAKSHFNLLRLRHLKWSKTFIANRKFRHPHFKPKNRSLTWGSISS